MSTIGYTPGVGNLPFGNTNTNPQASEYALISGASPTETLLIAKAIQNAIFDAAPAQYNALKLLYAKPFEEVDLDEFEYLENTFGRSALVFNAIVAATASGGAGTTVTNTYTFTAASMSRITVDLIIIFPDNSRATVTAILSGTTVTLSSMTSAGLAAVAVGDIGATLSTVRADAMTYFANYERLETVTRFNFVQFFLRAARWGRIELKKYENKGTTNYLVVDREQRMKQIRVDFFNAFFNGIMGEVYLSSGQPAKTMDGIYPRMVAAGSMNATVTEAGLVAAFRTLAFKTNFKVEGATRFIYGTSEILDVLSRAWKEPGIRYTPSDEIGNLNLTQYKIGSMNFVPVACELFREPSCFPAFWQRMLLIIDQETVTPVSMKGIQQVEMGGSLDMGGDNGSREDFKDWYVRGQLSLKMNNPLSSFYLNVL